MKSTIKSGNLEITATEIGAELLSVKYNDKERLWQNENGAWCGHAPVLFPVCGVCQMRIDGNVYPCSSHGFAKDSLFECVQQTENALRFLLTDDGNTRKKYPYAFRFAVTYAIGTDGELQITYEAYNPAQETLYFSCGGHDSFSLDSEPKEYGLEFEKSERFESCLTDDAGRLTGERQRLGEDRVLDLDTPLLENGNSVCLDKLNSRSVVLREKRGGKRVVRVDFPDSDKLVLWRPGKAKMLCIEPWQNFPDGKNGTADFSDKDGVMAVAPLTKKVITRTIRYY